MKLKLILLLFFSAFTFTVSYAEKGNKVIPEKMDDSHLTLFGLTINKNSFEDAQLRLGKAKIYRLSDEEEANHYLCYVSSQPNDDTILILGTGVLAGWKDISDFKLMSDKKAYLAYHLCNASNAISKNISTKSGIKLGISKMELKKILGMPTKESSNELSYSFERTEKSTRQIYVIYSGVVAKFLNDRLTSINIDQGISD